MMITALFSLLIVIAGCAALWIRNDQTEKEISLRRLQSVISAAKLIERRSPGFNGYGARMASLTAAMSEELEVLGEVKDHLEQTAWLFHTGFCAQKYEDAQDPEDQKIKDYARMSCILLSEIPGCGAYAHTMVNTLHGRDDESSQILLVCAKQVEAEYGLSTLQNLRPMPEVNRAMEAVLARETSNVG